MHLLAIQLVAGPLDLNIMSLSCHHHHHHHVRCFGTKIGKQSSSAKVVEEIPLEGGMGRRQSMKSLLSLSPKQKRQHNVSYRSITYEA